MGKKQIILRHIDKKGLGVEIGPSYHPVAPKKEGYSVHVIDHLPRSGLVDKYRGHDVDVSRIEDVDFVWQAGLSYSELTGKSKYYDWVIAAHVVEHVPDLIAFLNDCDAILKDTGVLSLVVPDKRYCFDYFRPVSGIGSVIDKHLGEVARPTPGIVAEHLLYEVSRSGEISWNVDCGKPFSLRGSVEGAKSAMHSLVQDQKYYDVHVWCFVPHSFRLLIADLYAMGLIPFREVSFEPTRRREFYMTLGRSGKGSRFSRMELMERMDLELRGRIVPRRKFRRWARNIF
ncbi:hypothetical protein MNBD_GAMMA15-2367 [hydrothermal vent metagenome]|uniref:Methyltransferase type 11 domain-containing protein n=1 Tax=hydrothermal vent metagenome TaxID=652676 RepID=A0A3B0YI40_9ZZZZ